MSSTLTFMRTGGKVELLAKIMIEQAGVCSRPEQGSYKSFENNFFCDSRLKKLENK